MNSDQFADFEKTVAGRPSDVPDFVRPGAVIGNDYVLEELLGRGGMGNVYRARHRLMGQTYALKLMTANQFSEVNWQRFQREAQVLARLNHPNIVRIFNLGIDREQYPFCVMELIDGVSLSELIRRNGPLSVDEAIRCFLAVAEALAVAHENKIIHRDVKPANIMLCTDNSGARLVKLVDFGLARVLNSDAGFSTRTKIDQRLTEVGAIFGSPLYMSPEQCLGDVVDHRTDIYSFGCSLFEALTGHVPFHGQNAIETFNLHIRGAAPTLREKYPDGRFSPELEQSISRMMEKKPDHRYGSMNDVIVDLQRLREGKSVRPEPSSMAPLLGGPDFYEDDQVNTLIVKPRRKFMPVALASLAFLALAGFATYLFLSPPGAKKVAAAGVPPVSRGASVVTTSGAASNRDNSTFSEDFMRAGGLSTVQPDLSGCRPYVPIKRHPLPNGHVIFMFDKNEDDAKIGGLSEGLKSHLARGQIEMAPPVYFRFTYGMTAVQCLKDFAPGDVGHLAVQHMHQDEDWQKVFAYAKNWTDLRRMEFRTCRVDSKCLEPLNKMSKIVALEFRDCTWAPQNLGGLKVLSQMQIFILKFGALGAGGGNLDIPRLISDLAKSPRLEKIIFDLAASPIDEKSFGELLQLKTLKSLELIGCRWTPARFRQVSAMPRLKELRLMVGEFADQDLLQLQASKTLEEISIHSSTEKLDHRMPDLVNASGVPIRFWAVK